MSSSDAEVVKITTGMLFSVGLSLISSRTSRPSFFGRFRSKQDQIRARSLGVLTLTIQKVHCFCPTPRHVQLDMQLGVFKRFPREPNIAGAVLNQKNFNRSASVPIDFIVSHFFLAQP